MLLTSALQDIGWGPREAGSPTRVYRGSHTPISKLNSQVDLDNLKYFTGIFCLPKILDIYLYINLDCILERLLYDYIFGSLIKSLSSFLFFVNASSSVGKYMEHTPFFYFFLALKGLFTAETFNFVIFSALK